MRSTDNPGYLLHHLSFVLDRQSDQLLQNALGIGFSQFKILLALKWHENVQQRTIAEYLGQTEASVSRQIKLLQQHGLLESTVSPRNRREHITRLTAKGNRLAERGKELLNSYHAPMFTRLAPDQQAQFVDILSAMHEYACQATKTGACKLS